tara:strand:+ start:388 stop:846 length:459 start_codon:yes stop_codon:yes gene_type:complete
MISAVIWIGGSFYYLLVLKPVSRNAPQIGKQIHAAAAKEFQPLVTASIIILISSGVILAFTRLTYPTVGVSYITTLAIKSALSVWMFIHVQVQRRHSAKLTNISIEYNSPDTTRSQFQRLFSGYNLIIILGLLVFLLSDLLKVLFESAIEGN